MSKKVEKLSAKRARLLAELSETKAAEKEAQRKADTRRKIITGGAILKTIETDQALKTAVDKVLKTEVADRDRHLFPEIFESKKSEASESKPAASKPAPAASSSSSGSAFGKQMQGAENTQSKGA